MRLVRQIQQALSLDLLKPQERARLRPSSHPTTGHCYVAAEALWHLYARAHGYVPCYILINDRTHWFLRHPNGSVLDPTAEQFDFKVDYASGIGCGFLTGNTPSRRCKILLLRISDV